MLRQQSFDYLNTHPISSATCGRSRELLHDQKKEHRRAIQRVLTLKYRGNPNAVRRSVDQDLCGRPKYLP